MEKKIKWALYALEYGNKYHYDWVPYLLHNIQADLSPSKAAISKMGMTHTHFKKLLINILI